MASCLGEMAGIHHHTQFVDSDGSFTNFSPEQALNLDPPE
jgi:hypothetical protein